MRHPIRLLPVVGLALIGSATAQTTGEVVLPESKYESAEATGIAFWCVSPFAARRQLVVDAAALKDAPKTTIAAIMFRRNGKDKYEPIPGRVWIELSLSNASRGPREATPFFASNRGPDHRKVFEGWVQLPKAPLRDPAPWTSPWAVTLLLPTPFAYAGGHLLIETVTRPDPTARPWWPIDALVSDPPGDVKLTGDSCIRGFGKKPAQSDKALLGLGGTAAFFLSGPSRQGAGLFALGTKEIDVDLKRYGAPDCRLRSSFFWLTPFRFRSHDLFDRRSVARIRFPLPADRTFKDTELLLQWLIVDPGENALGISTSNGIKVKIREPNRSQGFRWIESRNPASLSGDTYLGRAPVLKLRFAAQR